MADTEKWADTATARRATSQSGPRASRRAQIVLAAAAAIEEEGPDAGTARIAEIAGVARPHVYRHFSSREELLVEVARYAAGELKAQVRPALSRSGSPTEVIHGTIAESVAWASDHPHLYRFVTERRQTRDLLRQRMGRTHFLDEILTTATAHLRQNEIDGLPLDSVLAGLMGMVDASIIWWLDHRDEERDDLVDRLTRQVWLVLRAMLLDVGVTDPDALVLQQD